MDDGVVREYELYLIKSIAARAPRHDAVVSDTTRREAIPRCPKGVQIERQWIRYVPKRCVSSAQAILLCTVCSHNRINTSGNAPVAGTCFSPDGPQIEHVLRLVFSAIAKCTPRQVDCLRFGVMVRSFLGG